MKTENDVQNEEQEEQNLPERAFSAGKDMLKDAAKQEAKKMGKKAGKVALKIALAVLKLIMPIIIIIIICSLIVGCVYVIKDKIQEIASNVSINLKIGENGPIAPTKKEVLEDIEKELKAMGIDMTQLGLGSKSQAEAYLYKYKMASFATTLPYIKDGIGETLVDIFMQTQYPVLNSALENLKDKEVKGIVKIKRRTENGGTKGLEFKKYESFQGMISSNNLGALDFFSIDDSWNLCVAKYTKVITNGSTVITMEEVKIPYQTMISNYSMPFSFFITLQQATLNPEYVSAVADLIMEHGEIELTIFDSTSTMVTEETTTYDLHTKTKVSTSDVIDSIGALNPATGGITSSISQIAGETGAEASTIVRNTSSKSETTTTTTIMNSISADVTSANVWVIEKDSSYRLEKEEPVTNTQTQNMSDMDETEPSTEEGSWKTNHVLTVKETDSSTSWVKESSNMKVNPDSFLGLWRNSTGLYVKGITPKFKPKSDGGKLVKYGIVFSGEYVSPLQNLFSNDAMMCDLLEKNEDTQLHAQLMQELIKYYKADGNYTIDVDFNIFDTGSFDEISNLYGSTVEEKVWFALLDAGYDENGVAGAMGNLYEESGFLTNNVEDCVNQKSGLSDAKYTQEVNDGKISRSKFVICVEWGEGNTGKYGYGLAQWTWPSYKEELYDLAKSKGVGIDDEELQIEFLIKHMQRAGYSKTQSSPTDAAYKFHSQVERSADGPSEIKERANAAEAIYKKYHGREKPDLIEIDSMLTGEKAEKMKKMINEAVKIANDNRYTYSQARRYEKFYFDCSSFCARLYKQFFGIDIPGTTADYGTYGYVGPVNGTALQPGDVLWRNGHVEMWIGNNQRVGAHTHYATHPKDDISVTTGKGNFTKVYRFIK